MIGEKTREVRLTWFGHVRRKDYGFFSSHLSAFTLRSVPAWIMTCQCFRSSANSIVIWFMAISSFTRYRQLSFVLPRFRFPSSTVICNIFLVVVDSSLYRLWTCQNHLNLFSLRNSAIGYTCASFQMSTFLYDLVSFFLFYGYIGRMMELSGNKNEEGLK